jgi:hypothetical protein
MVDTVRTARARQLAKLPEGKEPPSQRAALAMAKPKAYQAAANARATLRAYAYAYADDVGYATFTLRRRIAAIARAHTASPRNRSIRATPAIREERRGIARTHGESPRRSAALAIEDIGRLVATCSSDLARLRDRAMPLIPPKRRGPWVPGHATTWWPGATTRLPRKDATSNTVRKARAWSASISISNKLSSAMQISMTSRLSAPKSVVSAAELTTDSGGTYRCPAIVPRTCSRISSISDIA